MTRYSELKVNHIKNIISPAIVFICMQLISQWHVTQKAEISKNGRLFSVKAHN